MSWFRRSPYPPHLQDDPSFGRRTVLFIWEVTKVVVISLAIIIPVRYFLIKPFYVKGASMEPNFYDHEYLIIDEISYRFREPQRGDIVVFRYPNEPSQFFIKRVIGQPNERIKIADGDVAIITDANPDGAELVEPYLTQGLQTFGSIELTLGPDEYYLLGDNRNASLDSRAFGPVKRSYIIGRTMVRGWPLNRIGWLEQDVKYNF